MPEEQITPFVFVPFSELTGDLGQAGKRAEKAAITDLDPAHITRTPPTTFA